MRRSAWALVLAVAPMACGFRVEDAGTGVPIRFEERPTPANEVGSVWGGWTDGTVTYDPEAYPGVDLSDPMYRADWGMRAVPALAVNTDDPSAAGYDAELATVKVKEGVKYLVADVHAKGTGYTQSGGQISYDPDGTGEDLSAFAMGGVTFLAKEGDDPAALRSLELRFMSRDFIAWTDTTAPPPAAHCGYAGASPCYDYPRATVSLERGRPFAYWRHYIIPFRNFAQQGYGQPVPDFFEARGLAQNAFVAFGLPRNVPFDFWIAAFGYYKAEDYPVPY